MIVLDSSAAVDFLIRNGRRGDWVSAHIERATSLHAPHLIDIEVAGALRRLEAETKLTHDRAALALGNLRDLALTRHPHVPFLDRIWQLRHNVTAADAAFVSLAEALDVPLLTTDRGLARAPGIALQLLAFAE